MSKGAWTAVIVIALVVIIGGVWVFTDKPAEEQTPPSTSSTTPDQQPGDQNTQGEDKPVPATGEPIEVGAILPLTGSSAHIGGWQKRGIELAISDFNKSSSNSSNLINIHFEDSKADSRQGVDAYMSLINRFPKIQAVFVSHTNVANAVMPLAKEQGIIVLLLAVSLPGIVDNDSLAFRWNLTSVQEGESMAHYLETINKHNISVAYINNEFGVGALDAFQKALPTDSLVVSESYNPETVDFRTVISKLELNNSDALYVIGYTQAAITLIKQVVEEGYQTEVFANMALSIPAFIESGGESLDNATYTVTPFSCRKREGKTKDFWESYLLAYDEDPSFFAAFAYDATGMLMWSTLHARDSNTSSISEMLYSLQSYDGALGISSVSDNGDVVVPLIIVRNSGGTLIEVE